MYSTMREIASANAAYGHNWFSPDTMETWGTQVESDVIGGAWFVTSDKHWSGQGRAYTVRHASDSGDVHTDRRTTAGQFDCLDDAIGAAHGLARRVSVVCCTDED
jgi:hypothetical protein